LERLRKRTQDLKKKRPGYEKMLDFFEGIIEEQEKIKPSLKLESISLKKEWKRLLTKEGFPLLQKEDFPLDVDASFKLFQSFCEMAEEANPVLAEQAKKVRKALEMKKLDLTDLLKKGFKEKKITEKAEELGIDSRIFLFLLQNATKPSIEAGMKQIQKDIESEHWSKGICPVCGSLPHLSLLREEIGKRFLLCSYCGHPWPAERFLCPFCESRDQDSLHYFYAEGEEAYRIDVCEKCRHYIKTIDTRKMDPIDPQLEDLATLHLDLLATRKGYQRPVPSPWVSEKRG